MRGEGVFERGPGANVGQPLDASAIEATTRVRVRTFSMAPLRYDLNGRQARDTASTLVCFVLTPRTFLQAVATGEYLATRLPTPNCISVPKDD